MSGHEFQIGDRVEYIQGDSYFVQGWIGLMGTVVEPINQSWEKQFNLKYSVPVKFDIFEQPGNYIYSNIKLLGKAEPEMTIPDYLFQRDDDI